MRISWPVEIRGASLLLALQRRTPDGAGWSWIGGWTPMSRGYLDDPDAVSGETYLYRLRARSGAGRISRNEPILGPVSVP